MTPTDKIIIALLFLWMLIVLIYINAKLNDMQQALDEALEGDEYLPFEPGTQGTIIHNMEQVKVLSEWSGLVEVVRPGDDFPTLLPEELVLVELKQKLDTTNTSDCE